MNKISIVVLTSLIFVPVLAWGQTSASPLPTSNEVRQLQLEALRVVALVLLDPTRSEADHLNAATVLVRNGDRTAMPLLTRTLLADPFPSVRRVVAEGLGQFDAPEAKFALREAALTGPIDSVRWASGVSLLRLDPEGEDILVLLLSDRETLSAAALSLQEPAFAKAFPKIFLKLVEAAFINAFPDAKTYNSVERAAMAKSLAELESQRAVPLLIETVNDVSGDPFVRGAAAFALGRLGARSTVPDLIKTLDSGLDALQVGALGALSRLKDPRSIEPLKQVLQSTNSAEIRAAAATALGSFGRDAASTLSATLNGDAEPLVRQAAITGLANTRNTEVVEAVITFVNSGYLASCDPAACSGLALATMSALAKLGLGELAQQLLEVSLDALGDVLPFVFAFAEAELISVAIEVATVAPGVINLLLDNENPFVQAIGLAVLPSVKGNNARMTLLQFADPEENRLLRRMAFEGLAQLAVVNDVDLFVQELLNRDRRTRAAAFSALVQIGDERFLAPLGEALAAEDLAIQLQAVAASINFGNRILNLNGSQL